MDNLKKRHVIVVDKCCICKRNGRLWTIFFFIVRLPAPYGILFSAALGCLGYVWADALGVLLCRIWCRIAFCGACGGNGMIETLKTKKG
jgi:hypothetical protein